MVVPATMPLISRGVPAFTNDDFTGAFPASHANDAIYGGSDYWRCAATPTGNANSGTLTQAVYLAYDLSGVSTVQRGQVIVVWYADAFNNAYRPDLIANGVNNLATSYTIDVNPGAGGGSAPGSGWITKATVTSSSPYHSRQHLIDMTGHNWVRINVTAITGSASNNNVALNMDVHDASGGTQDDWIFFGDSITQRGFMHDDQNGIGSILPEQIHTQKSSFYPVWEGAGIGGWSTDELQPQFATFLALFPGTYVGINMGTNDANLAGTHLTTFSTNMANMMDQVIAVGKIPVVPHIPWGGTANLIANVPTLNSQIDSLITARPTALAGPDLYAFFNTHQSEIDPTDHIHPTDPQLGTGNGYVDYRTQWVNWAVANVYTQQNVPYSGVFLTITTPNMPTAYGVNSVDRPLIKVPFVVNGTVLDSQPTVVTAPSVMSSLVEVGSTFLLIFNSPSTNTQNLLVNGSTVSLQFVLPNGQPIIASVKITSQMVGGTSFQVTCTMLQTISVYTPQTIITH